ncbi:MAG: hypothetical protein ACOWWO_03510 [Peptococcaceae bacterium]
MEGLKCPICKAVSLVSVINDGELYTCPFCNYRYTVTSVRRYFLHPYKIGEDALNSKSFLKYLKELDLQQLIEIIKVTSKEMEKRTVHSGYVKKLEKS